MYNGKIDCHISEQLCEFLLILNTLFYNSSFTAVLDGFGSGPNGLTCQQRNGFLNE